tara:strand:- start:546 stop:1205 length:660 start_codon:yes stop_codon:yes gene_type:complete
MDTKTETKSETIHQKLYEARKLVREGNYKKDGRNDYSKYDYFTPENVETIVNDVTEKTDTICITRLINGEYGLHQELDFIDLENPSEFITFKLATKHGEMKATNDAQQMGGTDTYSERYIKMKCFQIKDNNLDPDSQDNRPKAVKKTTTSPSMTSDEAVEKAKQHIAKSGTLEELEVAANNIKKSKNIPSAKTKEGKEIRAELDELLRVKQEEFAPFIS